MTDEQLAAPTKRDRSPSFPYLGLSKALERTQTLFEKAKRHEARVYDIARDWGLAPKSSSTDRNVAALLAYGLIEDSGSGEARKIKVSETGWRILDDKRPGVREKLAAEVALKPRIISDYAQIWEDGRPDDTHALSQLKFEGHFTDEGARMFLRVFDDTIRFTKPSSADKLDATKADNSEPPARAKIGEFVQWTSDGVDQFASPMRVTGLSDDGLYLWVDGSKTGVPMSEAHVMQPTQAAVVPPGSPPLDRTIQSASASGTREEKFALEEGDVIIRFPEGLSPDSVEDLADYIEVFLKKARRAANSKKEAN